MLATSIIAVVLLGLSGFLLDSHRRSWWAAQQNAALSASDLRFARSQYRRRTQSSVLIGVLGLVIAFAPLVPARPWPVTLYLVAIIGPCLAMILLAALDAWASRQNFHRLRSEQLAAQVKLARELRQNSGIDHS